MTRAAGRRFLLTTAFAALASAAVVAVAQPAVGPGPGMMGVAVRA